MPDLNSPNSIEPTPPPTLTYRVARAIDALRGRFPAPTTPEPKPISAPEPPDGVKSQDDPMARGYGDANYISAWYKQYSDLFIHGVNRQRRYQDYIDMDCGQVAAMLDAIVDSCFVSDDGGILGFKVEARSNKFQNIIEQVNKELDLTHNIRFILRDTLKFGDNFIGLVMDDNWNIVDYENPPARQMYAFTDEKNRLLTGTEPIVIDGKIIEIPRAFQQKSSSLQTVAGWFAWEMYHLKFFSSKQSIYSTKSFLEDMRADWFKLKMIEESLVIHRLTRAAPRNVHVLDVTGKSPEEAKAAMDEYVRGMTQKKLSNNQFVQDTLSVSEDYYLGQTARTGADGKQYPSLNDVRTIDPRSTNLQRLPDVDYLVHKIFSRVPSEIVGILPDRNDISSQDIAASRFYLYCQTLMEKQLLRPAYNLALSLRGYKPEPEDYRIIFPNVQMRSSWRLSDSRFRAAMGNGENINNSVVSRKFISQQEFGFSDQEWDAQKAEILKEQKEFGTIPNATKPALVRQGEKGTSPESLDSPTPSLLEQYRQQTAEEIAPFLKEMRELREEIKTLKNQPTQPNINVHIPQSQAPAPQVNVTLPENKIEVAQPNITVQASPVHVSMPEQQAPVVNVAVPEMPAPQVTVNVPEQVAPHFTVEAPQVTVENIVPEQAAPVVSNTFSIPEQFAHINIQVPEQAAPIVNVESPKVEVAPAQVNLTLPEQQAPTVNVNVPEQAAPIVNVETTPAQVNINIPETQVTVNVPEQSIPIVNVPPAQIVVEPALVTVNVPEQAAPVVVNEINIPEPLAPQITVNVPEQAAPIVNITQPEIKIENIAPDQPAPIVNVSIPEQAAPTIQVNVPENAIKIEVESMVELPDEEEMSFERDNLGKVVGATKKRKYTRRKKKQDEGSGNSGDSD